MAKKKEKTEEKEEKETKKTTKTSNAKRLEELEKKLGEMGDTISAQNEFIQGASVVINTLAYDPELRTAFQAKLKQGVVGEGEGAGQQQKQVQTQNNPFDSNNAADERITRQVTDVVASQRESIVTQFEKDFGISDLKGDEQKEARKQVESYLNDFGWSVKNIPLQSLRKNLEKAYVGTHADKLREEGKLEGLAQMRSNQIGAMGTYQGQEGVSEGEKPELTKGQREWAEKLGVDPKEAAKAYQNRDEEYQRKTPSDDKK